MAYVTYDTNNNVTGVFANPQSFQTTQVSDNDPAVVAFLNPPPPIPNILRRQFYQQLSVQAIITQAQALAAVQSGTIPPALQTVVNNLPAAEQFGANLMLAGDATFARKHPMTLAIGAAYGWTSAQIDTFFTTAVLL
jgi:hypothetical protein